MLSSSEGSVGEPDGPPTAGEAQPSVTYHSLQPTPILGCKHYMRNCSKWAECCSKWVSCRFCHDEVESHPYDRYGVANALLSIGLARYATRRMLCMLCQTEQEASNRCTGCDKAMAQYYCAVCKFWDNDPQKQIYHCDKCKMCRIGRREEYVHCDRCNVCLVKDYAPRHKCFERSLECDCPICGEYLFTSLSPVMFMRCGHAIHFLCHQEHVKNSYQCPVCLKSLDDMQDYFVRIDSLLDAQPMPEEYAMVRSQILCNDCEGRSVTKFHFVYHKCSLCGSYNTKLLKTFNAEADAQADDPHHGQETNEQV